MTIVQIKRSSAASVRKPSSVISYEARPVLAPTAFRSFYEQTSILPERA